MRLIYVETSVIGFMTARSAGDELFRNRQELTRRFWESIRQSATLCVSQFVLDEIKSGDPVAAAERMECVRGLSLMERSHDSDRLAELLVGRHLLPPKALVDAHHVAIATVAGADLLLTWNCTHIANSDKLPHIVATLRSQGFEPPWIAAPEELTYVP
jgi:hypothetical protein